MKESILRNLLSMWGKRLGTTVIHTCEENAHIFAEELMGLKRCNQDLTPVIQAP